MIPDTDASSFPVYAAQKLADELDTVATWLDGSAAARATAGQNVVDYQGEFADKYRADLATYTANAGEVVAALRQRAAALRTAIDQHRLMRRAERNL